jgi:cytosine/uracil/thiamine/allantoin permease
MIGGMIASTLWLNSTLLQGPLSRLFGNSDMSVFTGFIVAGVLYFLLARVFVLAKRPVQDEVQSAGK